MTDINKLLTDLVQHEGGYSNDPSDVGGETMYGITVKVARAAGYNGPMKDMPFNTAVSIYKDEYWVRPGFDKIDELFPLLAEKLFDVGVNCGINFACVTLQRCLNALNNGGTDYADVKVDGNIGPMTIAGLKAFLAKRAGDMGRRTMLFMVAAQQSNNYLELSESKSSQEKFEYGWQSQRALYDAVL